MILVPIFAAFIHRMNVEEEAFRARSDQRYAHIWHDETTVAVCVLVERRSEVGSQKSEVRRQRSEITTRQST